MLQCQQVLDTRYQLPCKHRQRGDTMQTEIDKQTGQEIIWILDAMAQYRHSREWFNRRIDSNKVRTVPQMGTNRLYLVVADVEKEHAKGEND